MLGFSSHHTQHLRTIMRYVHPDQTAQREAMQRYAVAMQRKKLKRVK